LAVSFGQLLASLGPEGLRPRLWLTAVAQFYGLPKAVEELNARRATGQVSLDLLAGGGGEFRVQVLGEQREEFLAVAVGVWGLGRHALLLQFLRPRR
jgi:hypothetical protein